MDTIKQYYLKMNPSGEFVEMIYRSGETQMSDGTVAQSLQYLSSSSVWMGSGDNNREELMKKLVPITAREAAEYAASRNNN